MELNEEWREGLEQAHTEDARDRIYAEIDLLARSFVRHMRHETGWLASNAPEGVTIFDVFELAPFIMAEIVTDKSGLEFRVEPIEGDDMCEECRKELHQEIDEDLKRLLEEN